MSKSGKTKKDIRPLSGGVSKIIKGTNQTDRSRATNAMHNQSMYDKLGQNNLQSPGPVEFSNQIGKVPNNSNFNSLKPMQNM